MEANIREIQEMKLVGMSLDMSMVDNKTFQLFRTFMPRRKEITDRVNTDVLDLRTYPEGYYANFSPATYFTKWALVEVSGESPIPADMESFTLPGGKYAVFLHKGLGTDMSPFQYIFTQWLPKSGHTLDDRPHFEVMGENYKPNDPNSEQEIWVPIK